MNAITLPKIRQWHSDEHNASDRNYIQFFFEITPLYTTKRCFNTKRGNLKKYTKIIKTQKALLNEHLKDVANTTQINKFTIKLIETVQTTARASFTLKNTRRSLSEPPILKLNVTSSRH